MQTQMMLLLCAVCFLKINILVECKTHTKSSSGTVPVYPLLYVQLTHQQVLDQLSHTGCSLCRLFAGGRQLDQGSEEALAFLHILQCLLPKEEKKMI